METQPENRKDKVSSEEILELLLDIKALAEEEKKKQQDRKDSSYQVSYSFKTT